MLKITLVLTVMAAWSVSAIGVRSSGLGRRSSRSSSDSSSIISSARVNKWGDWGEWSECPKGEFVVGMQLKTESQQGNGDDTALNAIRLLCTVPGYRRRSIVIEYHIIQSLEGEWGDWGGYFFCPENAEVIGFALRSEEPIGTGDDTAANNLRLICNSSVGQVLEGDGRLWGTWTGTQLCPDYQAVRGFRTQVEPSQGGNGDDTALNNVDMECVDMST